MLDFVEDPVTRYIGGSGGIEDSSLVCCIGSDLEFALWGVCDFGTKSREEGEKCNGIVYIYHFYSLAVEAGFYGDTGRVIGFFRKLSNGDRG